VSATLTEVVRSQHTRLGHPVREHTFTVQEDAGALEGDLDAMLVQSQVRQDRIDRARAGAVADMMIRRQAMLGERD
jgi:hypothetical protein